ncbi:hypothetical protein AWM70_17280 [Paenibacillus yonginensis]|uniref:Uncharacterized protein n=1 Tax=Paenibacillus yonginensis TaxID=1462996 RepID=A0A1B1N3U6_9BACL|nr:hypothetical protein [Paenibacillus yonginensis]ANS76118.1 hypothetical protein AWM70_17280 [Paenibacillus yonginensis]
MKKRNRMVTEVMNGKVDVLDDLEEGNANESEIEEEWEPNWDISPDEDELDEEDLDEDEPDEGDPDEDELDEDELDEEELDEDELDEDYSDEDDLDEEDLDEDEPDEGDPDEDELDEDELDEEELDEDELDEDDSDEDDLDEDELDEDEPDEGDPDEDDSEEYDPDEDVPDFDISDLTPSKSKQVKGRIPDAGVLSIVNSDNGKRVVISSGVAGKLQLAETVQIGFAPNFIIIAVQLGEGYTSYALKKYGAKKVVYSSELVQEVTNFHQLDFSGRTSITFSKVTYKTMQGKKAAFIHVNP